MEIEAGKTYKYLREKKVVAQETKDNLKQFTKIKKAILDALQEKEMTIAELTQIIKIPKYEVVYYLMSLIKYGYVQTGALDDMDEYFTYKLKK